MQNTISSTFGAQPACVSVQYFGDAIHAPLCAIALFITLPET